MNQGWECPRCRTVHAPHVALCACPPPTSTSTTPPPCWVSFEWVSHLAPRAGLRAQTAGADPLSILDKLRREGWSVAVHNDYHMAGKRFTFWLFTRGEVAIKGEGQTDLDALAQVRIRADAIDREVRR